jgi:FkbM family methyltransferase
MNWKLAIGSAAHSATHAVLASPLLPLYIHRPRGVSWLHDIQRFAGTRDLKTIFDVGANIGQTVHECLRYFPRAQIYSFEPVTSSFDVLRERYSKYPNVHPINKALGRATGIETIRLHQESTLNTLIIGTPRDSGLTDQSQTIAITTIDQFCVEQSLSLIDILKIDVQGYETYVIEGASEAIAAGRVRFIFAEVAFSRSDTDMQHIGDFSDLMEKHGFRFCGLYEQYRSGPRKQYVWFGNALYVRG